MVARADPAQTAAMGHTFDRTNLPLLVTLALGVFAGALDLGVLSPALPAIAHAFAISGRDVAWVFTLYLFANVVSIPVMTKLSDVYGRRPIYIACVATFVAGSILAITAPTFAGMHLRYPSTTDSERNIPIAAIGSHTADSAHSKQGAVGFSHAVSSPT